MKEKRLNGETGVFPAHSLEIFTLLSHEIRNPLNAINGISELLQKNTSDPHRDEYYKILQSTSENLLELVNNILDFSKLKSGTLGLTPREFNLKEKISTSLYSQKQAAIFKGLKFNLNFEENMPEVLVGDQVKLAQIFINIISNSIKFTNTGEINISIFSKFETDDFMVLEARIEDTGIGIPSSNLEKIFEAFHQGDEDINIYYAGTGLGLSITRDLIIMLGGKFTIESRVDFGTSFNFYLPLDKPSKRVSIPKKEICDFSRLTGKKVLLVEDNKINVLVITKFLQLWKMDIDTARDGEEAFKKIISSNFDVVLMDHYMPKMTGLDCMKKVRQLSGEKYSNLPVIALTAASEIPDYLDHLPLLFNDFINKPFSSDGLGEVLCSNCN